VKKYILRVRATRADGEKTNKERTKDGASHTGRWRKDE